MSNSQATKRITRIVQNKVSWKFPLAWSGHFLVMSCHVFKNNCFQSKQLLALTGALTVTLCYYYISGNFSDFHSVHWCNWCYKCHSKSLKQYQCNWCPQISWGYFGDILGYLWNIFGPFVHWSIGPLVHWSIGPLLPLDYWSNGPLVHWSIGPLVHGTTGPLVHWSTGRLVHWSISSLVHWSIGSLVHWSIGQMSIR